ncbi:MAG: hypothetical protein JW739_05410 [Opitutales bacterium]|nr:hypothetical protein [Opitutales bacterium]
MNCNGSFPTVSPYIYGTTRLGDDTIPLSQRVDMAIHAMEAGVWFHTSRQYGAALEVLRMAFDTNPQKIPPLIAKIGGETIEELETSICENLNPLNLQHLPIGQLCLGGALAESFASGGDCYRSLRKLQQQGIVGHFLCEVFPWTSQIALRALQAGYADSLISGYIFYLNPLQRFASNELWELLQQRGERMIAMRTVAGGDVYRLRDVPGAAWKPYLQERAVEVAPLFEQADIPDWASFCVSFAHSIPGVVATVGSTARSQGLAAFFKATQCRKTLPPELMSQFYALHARWAAQTDAHAEPWTM